MSDPSNPSDAPDSPDSPEPSGTEKAGGDKAPSSRIDFGHGLVAERVGGRKGAEESSSGHDGDPQASSEPKRREFLQKAGGVVVGTAIVAVPAAAAVKVVIEPLFREKRGGILARLTTLDAIEPGGPPQAFKVVADKTDAWTTYNDLPLGLVYVQRLENGELRVFSASCPHAGCAVEYRKEGEIREKEFGEHYYCPCHESAFALDGEIASAESPALRGLDTLSIDEERLANGEVWVRFQKFKAGIEEKQPIA